jgi:DNA-binding MarR family transcriptional regulator/GNAT superfamily N-acetyltransferase
MTAPKPHNLSAVPEAHVKAVRAFNRFYTQHSGALGPFMGSDLSLAEARVLYEVAHRDQATAAGLARELALDPGYLSRVIRRFEVRGWLTRAPAPADARVMLLTATDAGRATLAPLVNQSHDEAAALLAPLSADDQLQVIAAMDVIHRLLVPGATPAPQRQVRLRSLQPGDIDWVVQQHAELYGREYGWNSDFETLVSDVASQFVLNFQPEWERAWIAEVDGERAGSVFVVRKTPVVAQLRLLLLTPAARGLGLGGRLTDECIAFARSRGYTALHLWTHSCLIKARAIYIQRGFRLTGSEAYHRFGHDLVGETWELDL